MNKELNSSRGNKSRIDPVLGDLLSPEEHSFRVKAAHEATEKLVKMASGSSGRPETERDWTVIEAAFKLWAWLYPARFKSQTKRIKVIKAMQKNKDASSEDKNTHVQHTADIDQKFHDILKAIYPFIDFQNKKFESKFLKKYPLFKVPDTKV